MSEKERYSAFIEVEDGKLEQILMRLRKAEEEIFKCYNELRIIGVLKLKEPSEDGSNN